MSRCRDDESNAMTGLHTSKCGWCEKLGTSLSVVHDGDTEEGEVTLVYGCNTGVDSWKLVEIGGN